MDENAANLRELTKTIDDKQSQISNLFYNLYSMTSVRETRTTVLQGRNIKLLTIVSAISLSFRFYD